MLDEFASSAIDSVVEVQHVGLFQKLWSSIVGIGVGILLFLGSFALLYFNEGRQDLSLIAKTAKNIQTESPDPQLKNSLVAATGKMNSTERVSDPDFFRESAPFLKLERKVEMFAWKEEKKTTTDKNVGGSETRKTEYSYSKGWVSDAKESKNFKNPNGHFNPPMGYQKATFQVKKANLGVFKVSLQGLTMGNLKTLERGELENLIKNPESKVFSGSDLYLGQSGSDLGASQVNPQNPQVGDLKISYRGLPNEVEGTLFGLYDGESLKSFSDPDSQANLFRFFPGQDREQAIKTLQSEHKMVTWILRFLGFFLMWGGMTLFFGPIGVLMDILPIFGSISRGLISLMTFFVALFLTPLTIIIANILHNIWIFLALAVGGLIFGSLLVGFFGWKQKKSQVSVS